MYVEPQLFIIIVNKESKKSLNTVLFFSPESYMQVLTLHSLDNRNVNRGSFFSFILSNLKENNKLEPVKDSVLDGLKIVLNRITSISYGVKLCNIFIINIERIPNVYVIRLVDASITIKCVMYEKDQN